MNTLKRLNIELHRKQNMPSEIDEKNVRKALAEVEVCNDVNSVPLEQRGGEVLDQVNDVFNLMAMKIKMNAEARIKTAENFGNETRKYKVKPNVIYMKGPKDRLFMMTESVDQSFKRLPRDSKGIYGGRLLLPHEKKKHLETLEREQQQKNSQKRLVNEKYVNDKIAEKDMKTRTPMKLNVDPNPSKLTNKSPNLNSTDRDVHDSQDSYGTFTYRQGGQTKRSGEDSPDQYRMFHTDQGDLLNLKVVGDHRNTQLSSIEVAPESLDTHK